MTGEQLTLIEGVRRKPPCCYDDVIEAMETVLSNEPEMEQWDVERLASDIWQFGNLSKSPSREEVARCIRIWRERNQILLNAGHLQ